MNLQISAPQHTSRITLFLIDVLFVVCYLFAIQIISINPPSIVSGGHLAEVRSTISASQSIPQIIPVPEPPRNQPSLASQVHETLVPVSEQPQPVPLPVATPPTGK